MFNRFGLWSLCFILAGLSISSAYSARSVRYYRPDATKNRCSARCETRAGNGSCMSYRSDFCGYYARCVPRCLVRTSNRDCMIYGSDYCGVNARCVKRCADVNSDKTCFRWAADYCGGAATCVLKCVRRYSRNDCGKYTHYCSANKYKKKTRRGRRRR
ncbi:MAG: hypothetical protein ISR65_03405 [Bacteriovoracaceae bacterium]|nr:hypothetical protein [Bacteriovoracaceae bacterium]